MHDSSYESMRNFVNEYIPKTKKAKVADIGSLDINGSYKGLFKNKNLSYTGIDIVKGDNVDIVLKDEYAWNEIESESFDFVISGQMLEHSKYFWVAVVEMGRILKQGGCLCIIAPSAGRSHTENDHYRFLGSGLKAAVEWAGLEALQVKEDDTEPWKDSMVVAMKPKQKKGANIED